MTQLLQQFNIPIIATGGVSSINQIKTLLENKAALVGMATGLVKNPFDIPNLTKQI